MLKQLLSANNLKYKKNKSLKLVYVPDTSRTTLATRI
jgi:hypothetical protein